MLDILHGSGAVVEPTGLEVPDPVEYLEENLTKEEFEQETMDSYIIDLLNIQHDIIKYIKEYNVNLPELDSNIRFGQ